MSNIIGKDRDVNDTISIAKGILLKNGFKLQEKNILNPVEGIWSVHLKDSESQFYTNGKGSTLESALASAYCEFIERLGTGFFFDDFAIDGAYPENEWTFSPDELKVNKSDDYKSVLLNKKLWDLYDPESNLSFENFIDSGRCDESTIIAYPFNNRKNCELTYFPVELLKNIYASNGLSAGNSEKEALVQALSECIERGVKNHIIREGLSLPDISDEYLDNNGFLQIKKDIESFGFPVLLKDASLGGRFPVICALLVNVDEGTLLSSFGSHPNPHVAIERTLTELLQGRKLDNLDGFSSLVYDLDEAADEANIESHFINSSGTFYIDLIKTTALPMVLWEFDGDRECELDYLGKILDSEDYDFFYRTYNLDGIWVTQTVVPGLSEIYPVEDLEWDNRNRAGYLRSFLKDQLSKEELLSGLHWFDESYIAGHDTITHYLGISVGEDDSLGSIILDEIEILILSKIGKIDELKNILYNKMDINLVSNSRVGFWRCLKTYLFDESETVNLKLIYGTKLTNTVKEFIKGTIPTELFPKLGKDFSTIEKHKTMINVYKKYRVLRG